MKRNIGICIFVLFIIAVGVTVVVKNIDANQKEQHIKSEGGTEILDDTEAMIKTNATVNKYKYYIGLSNDRVTVFKSDNATIYLETDIQKSDLPSEIVDKLYQRIGYEAITDVYDFLESYSS